MIYLSLHLDESTNDSYWCTERPHLPRAWSSSSLSTLMTCPQKWYYRYIEGWSDDDAPHFIFGRIYHQALERYDRAIAQGAPWKEAVREAVRFAMKRSWLWSPVGKHANKRNRFTLIRSVVWYCCHFRRDVVETIMSREDKPAVEIAFRILLPLTNPDGEPYILHGYQDGLILYGDEKRPFVRERKHTAWSVSESYFEKFKLDNQMFAYTLAAKLRADLDFKGVLVDACEVGVNFSDYRRGFIEITDTRMDEWLRDVLFYIKQAELFDSVGHYPRNYSSCDKYGGCEFADVCSKDPSTRRGFLEGAGMKQKTRTTIDRQED